MITTNLLQNPNSSPFPFLNPNSSPFPNPKPYHSHNCSRQKFQPFPWLKSNPNFRAPSPFGKVRSGSLFDVGNGSYSGGLCVDANDVAGRDGLDLPVELSVTRPLPPALTLREAVEKMREAVAKLKLDPPCSRSGVLRFQVAVPPSTKALIWLCCQQLSLRVFPQFCFLREQSHGSAHRLNLANGACGVSGVGVAIYFHGSPSKVYNLLARYLSIDSNLITAYGFVGIHYNRTSSLMQQSGSSCYFIPQIELSEFESYSFIASTLVWDNSFSFTFGEAIQCLEKCLEQLGYFPPLKMNYQDMWMKDVSGDMEMTADDVQMVNLDAEVLTQINSGAKCLQLV